MWGRGIQDAGDDWTTFADITEPSYLRIVTEHSRLAMPETHIGLFPDVGGGWFLSRCPGHVGEYLAMTGETLGAAEAIEAGLADVHVRAADLPALLARLVSYDLSAAESVRACADAVASPPGASSLAARRDAIDLHFSQPTLAGITACEAAGIPHRNILAMQGPFTKELNAALLHQFHIDYMVTKDGGAAGGFAEKAEAAARCGVQLIVLRRPDDEGETTDTILQRCRELL